MVVVYEAAAAAAAAEKIGADCVVMVRQRLSAGSINEIRSAAKHTAAA